MAETIPMDEQAASRVIAVLRGGGVAVVPTDTVYATICDAFSTTATARLFKARKAPRTTPLSLLIRNPRQVIGLAREVPDTAERLMASYWPGALSLIFQCQPDMPWDLGLTAGTVTLRMPADDLLLDVAADIGPLACSGANRRGSPAPGDAGEAREQLGDGVDLYVEAGPRAGAVSTTVDCSGSAAEVRREGAVPAEHVRSVAFGDVPWGQQPAPGPPAAAGAPEAEGEGAAAGAENSVTEPSSKP